MPKDSPLDYQTACSYAGQLFLETRHEIERLLRENQDLGRRVAEAEKQRDEALMLLATRPQAKTQPE